MTRRSGTSRATPVSNAVMAHEDINVTPLIDVMLVLLVLFMGTTQAARKGLDVRLPATAPKDSPLAAQETSHPLILEIEVSGAVTVNRQPVAAHELRARLTDIYEARADKSLFVCADASLHYRTVVAVLISPGARGSRGSVSSRLRPRGSASPRFSTAGGSGRLRR